MSVKKSDKIKFYIFVTMIFASIIFIVFNWSSIRGLNIDTIVNFVNSKGMYSMFIYVLIFALKPFVIIIPSNVIVICGGLIFGPFKGLLLSMLGFWISATIAFYVSRILGKDFVRGIVGEKFINLDKKLKDSEFKVIFFLRIIPILPYDPLSYACGFTNINYFTFVIASLLGVLPETFCYNVMGKSVSNPLSPQFLIPLAVVIIIALFSKKFFNIKEKSKVRTTKGKK